MQQRGLYLREEAAVCRQLDLLAVVEVGKDLPRGSPKEGMGWKAGYRTRAHLYLSPE